MYKIKNSTYYHNMAFIFHNIIDFDIEFNVSYCFIEDKIDCRFLGAYLFIPLKY